MSAWKTIQRWFSLAGIFLAALSVITLVDKLANVELAGLFHDFIAYYQAVTRAVVSWLPALVNLHPPEIVQDYWVLSFWLTTVMISSLRQADPIPLNIMGHVGMYLFMLVLGYTFIGLLVGLSMVGGSLFASDRMLLAGTDSKINMYGYMRSLRVTFILSIVFVILFFALNAYAPGLGQ